MPSPDENDASTLIARRYDPTPPSDLSFSLVVTDGVDAGSAVTVTDLAANTLIGSSPACALRLTDRLVSRRHVAVDVVGQTLRVTDLQSTNGTSVNGLRVGQAFLAGGETIEIGSTRLRVDRSAKTTVATPSFATHFGQVIGGSREMRRLYPLCERLAATDVPLIIEGETGTGKEVLAEAIHAASARSAGPFVVFDCTAVAPSLLEAELFGHERGAFTGATTVHKGVFEQANKGTLLIDEIGDLEAHLQPKLLRAIERSEFRRVGGERPIRVDVRVIAATRRDLDREIEAGRFRDDLFHRLAVGRIELPPLRERRGDVAALAAAFARQFGGDPDAVLNSGFLARSQNYRWPGNVRELRNAVMRWIALGEVSDFEPESSSAVWTHSGDDAIARALSQNLSLPAARKLVVEEFERRYIEHMLDKHGGVVAHAARAAGIARRHFYRVGGRGPQK